MKTLFVLIFILSITESANILGIFHIPSPSHAMIYQKIIKDLSLRGHHLTILTSNQMMENYPNVTKIHIHDPYHKQDLEFVRIKRLNFRALRMLFVLYQTVITRSLYQLKHHKVQDLIDNSKSHSFDLILMEYMYPHPFMYFGEIFDCPVVGISTSEASNYIHSLMGNYINFAMHTDLILNYGHESLSLLQRLNSFIFHSIIFIVFTPGVIVGEWILRGYFPNITRSFFEIQSDRMEYLLQNTNPVFGFTRPITPNTILLGNLHIEKPKEIEPSLKEILDESRNGVIYVSFGTNINTNELNHESMSIFINTFKKLDYDVLWKLSGNHEKVLENSSNIFASKWYPQADLLAHPKVKLFITHCGLLSLEEAIDREVPMIAIPFLLDQYQNAFTVRNEKIGLHLELESLTEDILYESILEATKIEYKENIKSLKTLMYDVPMQTREKAVWWIEYAIRNKGRNKLKYIGTQFPFYKKYYLDILLIFSASILLIKKLLNLLRSAYVKKIKTE